jgi:hypothetical protein
MEAINLINELYIYEISKLMIELFLHYKRINKQIKKVCAVFNSNF